MDEIALLLPALAALHALEGAAQVPAGWWIFRAGTRGRFRAERVPGAGPGDPPRWRMLHSWTSHSPAFLVPPSPFVTNPRGDRGDSGVDSTRVAGRDLTTPGGTTWRFHASAEAPPWARALEETAGRPAAARAARFRAEWKARAGLRAIAERIEAGRKWTRGLRWLGGVALVMVFVPPLAFAALGGFRGMAAPWLIALVAVHAALVALAHRAGRALGEERPGRGTLLLALSPLASLRAAEHLQRRLLAAFEPAAVAFVLGDADVFQAVVRATRADLEVELRGARGDALLAAVLEARRDALEGLVHACGLRGAAGEPALAGDDASARSYCPRCQTRYVLEEGVCADCGDVHLRPLTENDRRAARASLRRVERRRHRLRLPGARPPRAER